jgi:hypothetical protein
MHGKVLICIECGEQPSKCECVNTKSILIEIKNTLGKKIPKGK